MDEELLQDFLIEAGELIEQLDEQLVGLEGAPEDSALLNSVFRAFHTIKGGAGFLALTALVELCHRAEDVLNLARSGERMLDAAVMDRILQSVDEVKRMFAELHAGQTPSAAPVDLLAALEQLRDGTAVDAPAVTARATAPNDPGLVETADGGVVDPVLAGFDAMLAQARDQQQAEADAGAQADEPPPQADEITEDEFDALLDRLQGRQGSPATPGPDMSARATTMAASPTAGTARTRQAGQTGDAEKPAPKTATGAGGEATLRVEAARVDSIMNLVGELVLVRNRLAALKSRIADEEIGRTLSQLNLVTSDLQASVMRLRMQPISKIFGRFSRVVRDLARQLHKEVDLQTQGESTELDKGMVESLTDPLVHLVRNAVDHGIEIPRQRELAGKPARGRVVLAAQQEGSHIVISVSDDGAGLDAEKIRNKALERGLIDSHTASQMSDDDALQLVFMPGLSTKAEISDVSGRGVGMDVVKSQISRVNGEVTIESERGKGSRVIIKLPLTLAIMPTLMVVVRGRRFALPLSVVEEIMDFAPDQRSVMDAREVFSLRGQVVPLLDLGRWVRGAQPAADRAQSVVIALASGQRVGLVVDQLIGQEEVVIKSLGSRLDGLPGFAGATITGDGDIALIVDVASLHGHWPKLAGGRGLDREFTDATASSAD